jgi:AcrR family transcriptional regulator
MATSRTARPGPRRSQGERRAATQAALLDATIECLVEFGYRNTTTTRVVERAGVSRGAQVHHFQTKAELVAAAVSRLATLRGEQLKAEARRLPPGRDRLEAALDLLYETYRGPLYDATIELWVVARTDPELRSSLAPREQDMLAKAIQHGRDLFGEYAELPDFETRLSVVIAALQGISMMQSIFIGGPRDPLASWERRRTQLARLFREPAPASEAGTDPEGVPEVSRS